MSEEVKFFFQPRHLSPPQPRMQEFLPAGDFLYPNPPLSPLAPQTPPKPPRPLCSAASTEFLWRLPRLPWLGVANHMPPIPGPCFSIPNGPGHH